MAFFDFPAEHWHHLRTTNAIESTVATMKLRTRVTKGVGTRKAALMMANKLMEPLPGFGAPIRGRELVPAVIAGAVYKDGLPTEQNETEVQEIVAA